MGSIQEEESLLLNPTSGKGGLKTIPFIILNESLVMLASIGLTPNMIFYLLNEYHMEVTVASTLLSVWSFISNGLAIFGAILADSYLGRFRVIALGCVFSSLGMAILWLTAVFPRLRPPPCEQLSSACSHGTLPQLALLVSSYALISFGAGCNRPCSIAFGLDQLRNNHSPSNEMLLQRFISWYNIWTEVACIFALTIIVYIQDQYGWNIGFGVPMVIMMLSLPIFLIGSSWYVKTEASKSLFVSLFRVFVVAYKRRNITAPPVGEGNSVFYRHGQDNELLVSPTDNLRFLNKACMIEDPERDLNRKDGSDSDRSSLCTVEEVEYLKALIRIFPMWSACMFLVVSIYQNSFATLQAETMNRRLIGSFEIPAGCFGVLMVAGMVVCLCIYDRLLIPLLAWYTGESRVISTEALLTTSLTFSTSAMAVSALVESMRRRMVVQQGLVDNPNAKVAMSAIWLVPQYLMMGSAQGLNFVGQIEFYYRRLPKKMSSIAIALYTLELGIASLVGAVLVNLVNWVSSSGGKTSWMESNINKGHIDYFYWLIAFLGCVNFLYYFVILRVFGGSKDENSILFNDFGG